MPDLERIYTKLALIRRVEERIAAIYPSDKIKSPIHLSIGQEFVAVGVCDVLASDDVVSPTYRCHAAYLAKGGSLNALMAELYGKQAGCAHGKGGSMHLASAGQWILGASAVVGTTIPVAAGFALAMQREGKGRVVAAFLGDGATEEGVFHETLNFAALHRLPILFVCENNFYAIHTPIEKRWATRQLCERVRTYGIPACMVEDGDVLAIRGLAGEFVERMRAGGGPAFLECHAYRWREHVGPAEDYDAGYRSREELRSWQERDQVQVIGARIPAAHRERIDREIEAQIDEAVAFAEAAEWPRPEELFSDVYAE